MFENEFEGISGATRDCVWLIQEVKKHRKGWGREIIFLGKKDWQVN
jgi:hypothetical protein